MTGIFGLSTPFLKRLFDNQKIVVEEKIVSRSKEVHERSVEKITEVIRKDQQPGKNWKQYTSPEAAGFSKDSLGKIASYFRSVNSDGALMIVYRGNIVFTAGDPTRRFMTHSMRKSLLSALYGINILRIDTTKTLKELNITEVVPLNSTEQKAKVSDLLTGRSGIYLPSAYAPRDMDKNLPERGSHLPGTYWFYNNWDFNVLGTIFNEQTGKDLFASFEKQLAIPMEMEDFRMSDTYYRHEAERSKHPAYLFNMSSRDLARFGVLYLNKGKWDNKEIVSADWIMASTKSHVKNLGSAFESKGSFGLLWWITTIGGERMFYASGLDGHRLCIFPDKELVIVLRTNTYQNRSLPADYVDRMLTTILRAQTNAVDRNPTLKRFTPVDKTIAQAASLDPGIVGEYQNARMGLIKIMKKDKAWMIESSVGVFKILQTGQSYLMEDMLFPVEFVKDDSKRGTYDFVLNKNREIENVKIYF
jgi:hypothetical protein